MTQIISGVNRGEAKPQKKEKNRAEQVEVRTSDWNSTELETQSVQGC